jgi:hypothetical protein
MSLKRRATNRAKASSRWRTASEGQRLRFGGEMLGSKNGASGLEGLSFTEELFWFELFRLVPEGFHLGARDFGERGVLFVGQAFHGAKATGEFGRGFF